MMSFDWTNNVLMYRDVMLGWKSARPSAEREVAGSNTSKTMVLQKLAW